MWRVYLNLLVFLEKATMVICLRIQWGKQTGPMRRRRKWKSFRSEGPLDPALAPEPWIVAGAHKWTVCPGLV